MPDSSNKFAKFWQELKRRKVVRVVIVYATTAFILLQLVDLIKEPLNLPQWVMTFFIVLLLIGFPIAVIFSWVFDITPQGVEVTKSADKKIENESYGIFSKRYLVFDIIIGVLIIAVVILSYPKIFKNNSDVELEKTIALLPPSYDSSDSSKIHLINGLWGAVIDNLSMVKDFEKVLPRPSVEKYRNKIYSIPDVAKELDVDYIVASNGQIIGDEIQFTISLIKAVEQKQFWSKPFRKSESDIEILQQDIAKEIANEINVQITPEEKERIEILQTNNIVASDYFYKGSDILNKEDSYVNWYSRKHKNLEQAVVYFKKALEQDNRYALACAELSYTLYLMNNQTPEKKYSDEIDIYADKAMLYDSKLDKSLIAKAVSYYNKEEYELAVPYLEEALHYNPNSFKVIWFLDYIYWFYLTNAEQQLEYALRAIRLNISSTENNAKSNAYNRLARAFRFAGFLEEAETYVEKALQINPDNLLAIDEKGQLLNDIGNYQQTKELLIEALKNDSLQIDIIRNLALTSYFTRNYTEAVKYWRKYYEICEFKNTNPYNLDNIRMGVALLKTGKEKESEEYYKKQVENIKGYYDSTASKWLAEIYLFKNENKKAIEQLKILSQQENYPYWIIRVIKDDPVYDNIRSLPEFKENLTEIEAKFWANHERIKASLTDKGLLPLKM